LAERWEPFFLSG
jgi:Fe2+-dicitrate sensor, membrane component